MWLNSGELITIHIEELSYLVLDKFSYYLLDELRQAHNNNLSFKLNSFSAVN